MTLILFAKSYLGTKEFEGPADNPKIMEMYKSVGHDWVEHDEVAWCAAFVGHCLERSGLRSSRKLNAQSYLTWGEKVAGIEQAREGDIVVLSRGNATWQGHVAFFLKAAGNQVDVLGGNQSNAVSVARYSKSRILGIRRAIAADAALQQGLSAAARALERANTLVAAALRRPQAARDQDHPAAAEGSRLSRGWQYRRPLRGPHACSRARVSG